MANYHNGCTNVAMKVASSGYAQKTDSYQLSVHFFFSHKV